MQVRRSPTFLQGVPDIAVRCASIRINSKGRLSPVADARTLVEIIFALPGTQACYFRHKSALQLCRLIGGDTALVGEIKARNQFWQETEARREVQRALLEKRTVSEQTEQGERTPREADVRDNLARREQGKTDVETRAGFADVVTSNSVIEVKLWKNWKHALGQVLAYGTFIKGKEKRIHLFADATDKDAACTVTTTARDVCSTYGVTVTLEILPSKRLALALE
jgi:hypothetical protein